MDFKSKGFWIGVALAVAIQAIRMLLALAFLKGGMNIFTASKIGYGITGAAVVFWFISGRYPKIKPIGDGLFIGSIVAQIISAIL